jgi:hypothetical protein
MIRIRVPAQQAKPGPPLSPVLGQHQIKVAEFVTQFNAASGGWAPGTPLGVRIYKDGTRWTLKVLPPPPVVFLGGLVTPGGVISREDLWASLGSNPTPTRVITLFGTLRSLGWTVQ